MKTYVLYHHPCPDGCTAAAIAKIHFDDFPPEEPPVFIGVNYGAPPPDIEDGSDLWILDFSYPRQTLLDLKTRMRQLHVLDHHKTAQADCDGLDFCTFDMNVSGAVLTWNHFWPSDSPPEFVRYVMDRDLWQFKLPQSREFSAGLRTHAFDYSLYANFIEFGEARVVALKVEGNVALRMINSSVDAMCKNVRTAIFDLTGTPEIIFGSTRALIEGRPTWFVPVVNASVFFSEVGERLLELHPTAKFSAYYFDRADKRQWGIRSRPDFDASHIAKAFGGGGHPQACGFITDL